jgi:Flp pilus assembly protein TadG
MTSFRQDRSGNVMTMFAFALFPVMGIIGASVDYARLSSARAELQSMIDTASLSGAALPATVEASAVKAKVEEIITKTLESTKLSNIAFTVTVDTDIVKIEASGLQKTTFAGVFGLQSVTVSGTVTAQRPRRSRADIALVLDNTGSMNDDGKLAALKSATLNMTTSLRTSFAARPADIRVSIVPFSVGVRMPQNFFWEPLMVRTETTIRSELGGFYTWSGCITDRPGNFDVDNVNPNFLTDTPAYFRLDRANAFPIPNVTCPGSEAKALTSDLDGPVGLYWGRQSLSGDGMIPGGYPAGTPEIFRYLVFLTDGDNTLSHEHYQANGALNIPSPIDDKMLAMCAAIRSNDGVIIYTVGFGTAMSQQAKDKLAACAGDSTRAKLAANAAELTLVFDQIAKDVQRTRLKR